MQTTNKISSRLTRKKLLSKYKIAFSSLVTTNVFDEIKNLRLSNKWAVTLVIITPQIHDRFKFFKFLNSYASKVSLYRVDLSTLSQQSTWKSQVLNNFPNVQF